MNINVSAMISMAAISAAHRAGYYEGMPAPTVRARPGSWKDRPVRGEDSASETIGISINHVQFEVIKAAAEDLADGNSSLFIIGSALRFIAEQQRARPELKHIELPEPFARRGK